MSTEALRAIRELWRDLVFDRIAGVDGRPEDFLKVELRGENGAFRGPILPYKSRREIPRELWGNINLFYRRYRGCTAHGILFRSDGTHRLDFFNSGDLSLRPSRQYRNIQPIRGWTIGGLVEQGDKFPRFTKWFVCPPQLFLFIDAIRNDPRSSENFLARQVRHGDRHVDVFEALLRLIAFDNVQLFVGCCERGIKLDIPWSIPDFIHQSSCYFRTPEWWNEFRYSCAKFGIEYEHNNNPERPCNGCAFQPQDDWERIFSAAAGRDPKATPDPQPSG